MSGTCGAVREHNQKPSAPTGTNQRGQPSLGCPQEAKHRANCDNESQQQQVCQTQSDVIRPLVWKYPPEFNGTKPNPVVWLDNFEKCARTNSWSEQQMVSYFQDFLGGPAYDWYLIKDQFRAQTHADWKSLRADFCSWFIGLNELVDLECAISNIYQGANEPSSAFISRLVRLVLLVHPKEQEKQLVSRIKKQLRSSIQKRIKVDRYSEGLSTLDELIESCKRAELEQFLAASMPRKWLARQFKLTKSKPLQAT